MIKHPANGTYLPEKPEKRHIDAIFSAWDHYGPGSVPRLLGTPEAQRIYAALLAEAKKASHDLTVDGECFIREGKRIDPSGVV